MLVDFLNTTSPDFACLITGEWGVGKTYQVKEIAKRENREILYVSLYGMSELNEIDFEIFSQLHPFLSSKKTKIAGKIVGSLLKTTFRFDLDGDGKNESGVSSTSPNIDYSDLEKNLENKIMVFDDFERSNIGPHDILSYINGLIDKSNIHCIIIANENELFKSNEDKDNYSEDYKRKREKVIGQIFNIKPDIESFLKSKIDYYDENKLYPHSKLLKNNWDAINEIFSKSNTNSLRILDRSIEDTLKILLPILSSENINQDKYKSFIPDMEIFVLCYLIEHKVGESKNLYNNKGETTSYENLLSSESLLISHNTKINDADIKSLYEQTKGYLQKSNFPIRFIDEFIEKGKISKNSLLQWFQVEISGKEVGFKNYSIFNFESLSEKEFLSSIKSVEKDLANFKVVDLSSALDIFILLMYLSEHELYKMPSQDILVFAKAYLRKLESSNTLKFNKQPFITTRKNKSDIYCSLNNYLGEGVCSVKLDYVEKNRFAKQLLSFSLSIINDYKKKFDLKTFELLRENIHKNTYKTTQDIIDGKYNVNLLALYDKDLLISDLCELDPYDMAFLGNMFSKVLNNEKKHVRFETLLWSKKMYNEVKHNIHQDGFNPLKRLQIEKWILHPLKILKLRAEDKISKPTKAAIVGYISFEIELI